MRVTDWELRRMNTGPMKKLIVLAEKARLRNREAKEEFKF